jgi:hypothetical protein
MTESGNKITKAEYLKALEIVESYHEQVFHDANLIRQSPIIQTKLSELLQKRKDIPTLLRNALSEYLRVFGDLPLEAVSKSNFYKIRNAGKKSWDKFEELREEYITGKLQK